MRPAEGAGSGGKVSDDVPKTLIGDPDRLRQIIVNLVGNAIMFTESGSVTVDVTVVSEDRSRTDLHFQVKDAGIGIPAQTAAHL